MFISAEIPSIPGIIVIEVEQEELEPIGHFEPALAKQNHSKYSRAEEFHSVIGSGLLGKTTKLLTNRKCLMLHADDDHASYPRNFRGYEA